MRYSKLMSMRKKKEKKNKKLPLSMVFLPEELIVQILSLLNVKTIVRFKCVSKSWNTIISDPTFVQKQLKRPPRLILTPPCWVYPMHTVQSLPVTRLLENPSITLSGDFSHDGGGFIDNCKVVNSCNGLLCLIFCSDNKGYHNYWFRIWNPATGTRSKAFGTYHDYNLQLRGLRFNFGSEAFASCYHDYNRRRSLLGSLKFAFGCDILSGTYKVVEFCAKGDEENKYGPWRSQVRILNLSDDCWRNIDSFPLIPLISPFNNGVYFSGTIYWLAIQNYFYPFYAYRPITHVDQFKIVSLDLSTETYMQFCLPSGFDEVPSFQPTLQVLLDRLCFSHDFKKTQFVIWQMKEFGFQESWTQLFRIDYFNLEMHNLPIEHDFPLLLPLCLSENGDTLILSYHGDDEAVIYNQRENRVKKVRISGKLCRFSSYGESLISTNWK